MNRKVQQSKIVEMCTSKDNDGEESTIIEMGQRWDRDIGGRTLRQDLYCLNSPSHSSVFAAPRRYFSLYHFRKQESYRLDLGQL